jgi:hypothetical protein
MSTFYLLPPRPSVGERFAGFLETFFPGLDWESTTWSNLADLLASATAGRTDVYLVYGEELPEGADRSEALRAAFGAEDGDEIVEVQPGNQLGEVTTRRWRLTAA